ncbi:MAG: 1-acyl-sn-glycerol-3-phosphate acyltransferase [Candidatus Omnitrophica bacterium]|nr:1-acyl-sn-glycerol-3-phosphate acyltransferase [Candidatus Omnitrophota bacterium]
MKRAFKVLLVFLSILFCIVALSVIRLVFVSWPLRRTRIASYVVHYNNKFIAAILGIKIKLSGQTQFLKTKGTFFVSNHLSYIDGVVVSSISPLIFIGRSDLKTWPLFGALTNLSDTIFVNRINYSNIHNELERIVSVLRARINVVLFPEGTSTNGKELLPFKTSFFEAPLKAGCRIVPLAIRYLSVNGQEINQSNQDFVYWYGDMYFFPHLLGVAGLKEVVLEVKVFEPLETENVNGKTFSFQRKYVGSVCQEIINNHLNHHETKT